MLQVMKLMSSLDHLLVKVVESIDLEKETAKVLVDFLGNLTPMEIELVQLEKADL